MTLVFADVVLDPAVKPRDDVPPRRPLFRPRLDATPLRVYPPLRSAHTHNYNNPLFRFAPMPLPDRILQHAPALTLALAAIAIIVIGRSYRVGTLTDMGPGFMPVLGGTLLLLLVSVPTR